MDNWLKQVWVMIILHQLTYAQMYIRTGLAVNNIIIFIELTQNFTQIYETCIAHALHIFEFGMHNLES